MSFWKKNDPLPENFQKFITKVFIMTQIHVLCANFVKVGQPEVGEIAHCLPEKKSPRSLALASEPIAPKICQGQRQTMYLEYPKFHQNPFTSGGVIAERVNTIQTHHKVFPILCEATASSPSNNHLIVTDTRFKTKDYHHHHHHHHFFHLLV